MTPCAPTDVSPGVHCRPPLVTPRVRLLVRPRGRNPSGASLGNDWAAGHREKYAWPVPVSFVRRWAIIRRTKPLLFASYLAPSIRPLYSAAAEACHGSRLVIGRDWRELRTGEVDVAFV